MSKHKAREKRKAKVLRIWKKHYPDIKVEDVANLTGLSYRTIYRYLSEAGQPLPPKKSRQLDTDKVKRAHHLFAKHGKKAKVARIMKMSRQRINAYLKMKV